MKLKTGEAWGADYSKYSRLYSCQRIIFTAPDPNLPHLYLPATIIVLDPWLPKPPRTKLCILYYRCGLLQLQTTS